MKKMTRLLSLALVLVLCLSVLPMGALADDTKGWLQSGDYWYYFENGSPVTGWKKLSGSWYYFWDDGTMAASEWLYEDGDWYWFKSSGKMAASEWVKNTTTADDGTTYTFWYYQLSNGKNAMGWQKIGGAWYYFYPDWDGEMLTGGPYEIDGSWYYFKDSGALFTGWKEITNYDEDGNAVGSFWSYFTSNGAVMNGWKKISGKWYYFSDGAMQTGLKNIDGKYYYFYSSGAMATGWFKYDGTYLYATSSGALKKDGWLKIGGYYYYFEDYGYYYGGSADITESSGYTYEYYFYDSGKMAASTWIHFKDSNGNYIGWAYYLSNGHRIQSGSIKLGGKWYYFSGGWCTNP